MARLPPPPFLYAIVDLALLRGRPVEGVVADLLAGGAGLLQVRGKDESARGLLAAVRAACAAAAGSGVPVLVNDRPDIALLARADGVHVGQDDLPPAACRALLGAGAIVGASTHSLAQVAALQGEPVDYLALGPVFSTATKPDHQPVVGLETMAAARSRLPLVAIGGITAGTARAVIAAGAAGVAAIGSLLGGDDVAARTRALRQALESAS